MALQSQQEPVVPLVIPCDRNGQYDDAQACPLLNASDEPPDASSSLTGQEPVAFAVAVTLPKNLKAADRALKGWQKHKLALWLYMIVGAMVICSSVQNSFAPSILPAALGIGIAMWGLLFLTWTPDMQLHSVDELLQAQHGAAAIIALCSIAMGVVFAGHKLNCYQLGLSCVHAEGIHDWRWVWLLLGLVTYMVMSIHTAWKAGQLYGALHGCDSSVGHAIPPGQETA